MGGTGLQYERATARKWRLDPAVVSYARAAGISLISPQYCPTDGVHRIIYRFESSQVGLDVPNYELFGGKSRYKESRVVGLDGLVRTGAATGTRLWTMTLPTNTQDVPKCGAQYPRRNGTLWRAP